MKRHVLIDNYQFIRWTENQRFSVPGDEITEQSDEATGNMVLWHNKNCRKR